MCRLWQQVYSITEFNRFESRLFPSLRPVVIPMLKRSVYPTTYPQVGRKIMGSVIGNLTASARISSRVTVSISLDGNYFTTTAPPLSLSIYIYIYVCVCVCVIKACWQHRFSSVSLTICPSRPSNFVSLLNVIQCPRRINECKFLMVIRKCYINVYFTNSTQHTKFVLNGWLEKPFISDHTLVENAVEHEGGRDTNNCWRTRISLQGLETKISGFWNQRKNQDRPDHNVVENEKTSGDPRGHRVT